MHEVLTKNDKKNLKRKRILESASNLFSQKNYHEVMMEDVAKLAHIAKGTVYNYFTSKEDLYFTIMKLRMEKLTNSLKEKIKSESSSISALHTFVIHLYMFMMKYQDFFLIYQKETMKAENHLCSELHELENELSRLLTETINKGKKEKVFRELEEELTVDLVIGSVYGAVSRGIEKKYSEEKIIIEREKIFKFILYGLISFNDSKKVLPLLDKKIVLTRTVEQSKESSEIFKQLGADVVIFPTLDIVPPESWKSFDEVILSKGKIDFIIFTSAYAVKMFAKRLKELSVNFDFSNVNVVAVGNKTANVCLKNNIDVDIIPREFSANGVIAELEKYNLKNKVVFIPRSAIGREELPIKLKEMGAVIKSAPVYNIALPAEESIKSSIISLKENKPDMFIFTSPSTFENFLQIMNIPNPSKYFNGFAVAAIGPTTRTAIENRGVEVNVLPDEYTMEGLAKVVVEFYK